MSQNEPNVEFDGTWLHEPRDVERTLPSEHIRAWAVKLLHRAGISRGDFALTCYAELKPRTNRNFLSLNAGTGNRVSFTAQLYDTTGAIRTCTFRLTNYAFRFRKELTLLAKELQLQGNPCLDIAEPKQAERIALEAKLKLLQSQKMTLEGSIENAKRHLKATEEEIVSVEAQLQNL